jgi:hypothetical protein
MVFIDMLDTIKQYIGGRLVILVVLPHQQNSLSCKLSLAVRGVLVAV